MRSRRLRFKLEAGSAAVVEYLFSVAAGILPAVEPGILPGGMGVWSQRPLPLRNSSPGGKMPPFTAAKMAAATDVSRTLNTYVVEDPAAAHGNMKLLSRYSTPLAMNPRTKVALTREPWAGRRNSVGIVGRRSLTHF